MLKKNQKGFTIIEVLIVLAIAGLIMLIVFLAVPALQRNSRNTQIKNDVANVLGGVSDFVNNNNGQLPTTISVTEDSGDVTISGPADEDLAIATAKVKAGTVVSMLDRDADPLEQAGMTLGSIYVLAGYKCDGNTPVEANRAIAAQYLVETGSGADQIAKQCQES